MVDVGPYIRIVAHGLHFVEATVSCCENTLPEITLYTYCFNFYTDCVRRNHVAGVGV